MGRKIIFLAVIYLSISCTDKPDHTNYLVRYSVNSNSHTVRVEYRNSKYGYACQEITGKWMNFVVLPVGSMASLSLMIRLDMNDAFSTIENKDSLIYASVGYANKQVERKSHVIFMALVIE